MVSSDKPAAVAAPIASVPTPVKVAPSNLPSTVQSRPSEVPLVPPSTQSPQSVSSVGTAVPVAAVIQSMAVQQPVVAATPSVHAMPQATPTPLPPPVASKESTTPTPASLNPRAASPVPTVGSTSNQSNEKIPRRKPGARECVQISRRFGVRVIPDTYMEILTDYSTVSVNLIRMRERLDEQIRREVNASPPRLSMTIYSTRRI